MTHDYDNMTMTIRHDIMTDVVSGRNTSQCNLSTKQCIYFYNVNTSQLG